MARLALGPEGQRGWQPLSTYDDGCLLWVRLPGAEAQTERPMLPVRPADALDAVIRVEADCDAQDVIANRLDPWHGAHSIAHAVAQLVDRTRVQVLELTSEVAATAVQLPASIPKDPADRLIVATALCHAVPLVTRDARIQSSGACRVIW